MALLVGLTKNKAFGRLLSCLATFMLIFMVLSPLFVQCSRTRILGGTTGAEDKATKELGTNSVKIFGYGGSAFSIEVSARQVPTGPDPLHHNTNPSGP